MIDNELRCTYCGSINEIEEETNEYFVCSCCGTKVLKQKSNELIQNIKKLNLESTAQQLKNYRTLLNNSLKDKNIEFQNDVCKEILTIIPSDFQANLYNKLINKNKYPKDYERFLENIYLNYSIDEIKPYLELIINHANFNELTILNKIINNFELNDQFNKL